MKYTIKKIHFLKTLFLAALLCLLFSCENDIKTINTIGNKDDQPVETATDVETIYSDSGRVSVIVKAPQLDRYEGENPYTEMPKGVSVFFYDSAMNVRSKLTAKYAISYEKEKIMEAKNDVVVVNEKQEQLNTEHLVWDQKKATIYSDKFVKINTGKEILWGDGLDADERFDRWKIKKPKGSITINEDE
jgi:LPS export ABC transporter protein LptC